MINFFNYSFTATNSLVNFIIFNKWIVICIAIGIWVCFRNIIDIIIRNDSNNSILLDTREKTKETYLVDSNGIKYEAILYENNINDLTIDSNQVKKIQIKFNVVNREDLSVKSINFDNIVLNYEQYKLKSEEKEVGNIEIGL